MALNRSAKKLRRAAERRARAGHHDGERHKTDTYRPAVEYRADTAWSEPEIGAPTLHHFALVATDPSSD